MGTIQNLALVLIHLDKPNSILAAIRLVFESLITSIVVPFFWISLDTHKIHGIHQEI